ncbi:hypothetical protein HPB50_000295 [Hyalomma asiaticum]|uniref:Uncharacterized protein n=1 Tax=Hyalomma asiaticum TaxID=266040 RepID=A0ACB7RRI6_HYAAI|nr:hypothetical protein HPB50_000295 [Hyalomma asiaticum]
MVSADRTESEGAGSNRYIALRDRETVPTVSTVVSRGDRFDKTDNLPVAEGHLNKHQVSLLRDNGCDTVAVGQALVPTKKLMFTYHPVVLMDRTPRYLNTLMVQCRTGVAALQVYPYHTSGVTPASACADLAIIITGSEAAHPARAA